MGECNATSDVVESGSVGRGRWTDSRDVDARMSVVDFALGLSVAEVVLLWTVLAVLAVGVHYAIRSPTPPDEEIDEMREESQRLRDALSGDGKEERWLE